MAKVPRSPSLVKLAALVPVTLTVKAGTILWRIYYRGGRHPTLWSDFRHVGPVDSRFDHHLGKAPADQERSVIYVGRNATTCLAEAFQKTRLINRWHRNPWLVGFETTRAVSVLDLTGSFCTRAGASMGLMTGPRSVGRNWAKGFYGAYADLAGICYPSSMHGNNPALVLTDRAEAALIMPEHPAFHRALGDASMLDIFKNSARELGYALS